ncbi:MAG: hypothetical protein FWG28_06780 [Clostridiales bacterium]|nr:hypothetical protein [Clostridiales bacterium]
MTRKVRLVIAVIAALALLMTGTFTWYQAAEIRNEFSGTKDDGEVTIRDDFDGNAMKDVFVENKGNTILYVRAKLDEAMSLSSNTWRPGTADWVTHTFGAAATDCGHRNHTNQWYFHDYFKWTMGGWKYYKPSPAGLGEYNDTTVYNGTEDGVRRTPDAKIVTAAAWQAYSEEQKEAFIGWIYAPDGYAYWSQPLAPDSATGLLLHGVQRERDLLKQYNYYYAINVIVEIADYEDVPMMRNGEASVTGDGATYTEADGDGKDILDWLTKGEGDGGTGGGGEPGGGDEGDGDADGDGDGDGDGGTGGGETGTGLPVGEGPFIPRFNGDPYDGDGYFMKKNFLDPDNTDPAINEFYHNGSIHLEDIITDGDYTGVSVAPLNAKYTSYLAIGNDHHGKPSIIYSYPGTSDEWNAGLLAGGDLIIPIQVTLTRGGQSAEITIHMTYPECLITYDI